MSNKEAPKSDHKSLRLLGRTINEDELIKYGLMALASVSSAIMILIILFILANSLDALTNLGLWDFITGERWRPSLGLYGAKPLIVGTLLVTAGSIAISLPLGLGAAIFISELAPKRLREPLKLISELFSSIPSVVYGFFGLVVLVPFLLGTIPGATQGESWLAGSILLGIMALPTIISVAEDAISSVPSSYREASLAMGATRWQTTSRVVIPAAISGISAAAILGMGRAIGETMAVMMVTGNAPIIPEPLNDLMSPVRTITATLAIEMKEVVMGGVHYSALFLLALILFVMVLLINTISRWVMGRMKEKFNPTYQNDSHEILPISAKIRVRQLLSLLGHVLVIYLIWLISELWFGGTGAIIAVSIYIITVLFMRMMGPIWNQRVAHFVLSIAMGLVLLFLAIIIYDIVSNGLPVLSVEFLTEFPSDAGRSGGIYPAIVGTLKLIIGTMAIAIPLGVISGIYLAEYSTDNRYTRFIRAAIDNLAGTPSVVFGLFGLAAFVLYMDMGHSLLAGWLTLSFLVLPTIIRTTEEAIKMVPNDLKEASLALGASKWETVTKVVLPAAFPGILTGTILSIGRAAGETAPIMFTAVVAYQTRISGSITDPVMALPYHLYYLASEVPNAYDNQYGTALVLLLIVVGIYSMASVLRYHYRKKAKW